MGSSAVSGLRRLPAQLGRRQATHDLAHGQTLEPGHDLKALAREEALSRLHPYRYALVQPLRPLAPTAVQELRSGAPPMPTDRGDDRCRDAAAATARPHIQPAGFDEEPPPEHVVTEPPLAHADDVTVALGHEEMRDGTFAEIRFTQRVRGTRGILGLMAFDEVVDHLFDGGHIVETSIANEQHEILSGERELRASLNHVLDRPVAAQTETPKPSSCRSIFSAQPWFASGLAGLGCRIVPMATFSPASATRARRSAKPPTPMTMRGRSRRTTLRSASSHALETACCSRAGSLSGVRLAPLDSMNASGQ